MASSLKACRGLRTWHVCREAAHTGSWQFRILGKNNLTDHSTGDSLTTSKRRKVNKYLYESMLLIWPVNCTRIKHPVFALKT